jgi:hypothetical protein
MNRMILSDLCEPTRRLILLYFTFCKQWIPDMFNSWICESLYNSDVLQDFKNDYKLDLFENINITINPNDIDKYYEEHNILILHEYKGQTKIIGCCGNGYQQIDSGGYLLEPNEIQNYREKHFHSLDGYYSIDATLQMVPDCIANFEVSTFPFIKDNSITEFCVEGGCFDLTSTFINELSRILTNNGVGTFKPNDANTIFVTKINDVLVFNKN